MKTYYFTFGSNHVNQKGEMLLDFYCPIDAYNEEQARNIMYALRGDRWAFVYDNKEDAGVEKYELKPTGQKKIMIEM